MDELVIHDAEWRGSNYSRRGRLAWETFGPNKLEDYTSTVSPDGYPATGHQEHARVMLYAFHANSTQRTALPMRFICLHLSVNEKRLLIALETFLVAHSKTARVPYLTSVSGIEDFGLLETSTQQPNYFQSSGGVDPARWDETEKGGQS